MVEELPPDNLCGTVPVLEHFKTLLALWYIAGPVAVRGDLYPSKSSSRSHSIVEECIRRFDVLRLFCVRVPRRVPVWRVFGAMWGNVKLQFDENCQVKIVGLYRCLGGI